MHDAGHPVKVKFAFRVRTWIGSTQNKKLRQRAKKTDDKNLKDQSTKEQAGAKRNEEGKECIRESSKHQCLGTLTTVTTWKQ